MSTHVHHIVDTSIILGHVHPYPLHCGHVHLLCYHGLSKAVTLKSHVVCRVYITRHSRSLTLVSKKLVELSCMIFIVQFSRCYSLNLAVVYKVHTIQNSSNLKNSR